MTQIQKSLLTIDDVSNYRSSTIEEKDRIKNIVISFMNSVVRFKEQKPNPVSSIHDMSYIITMLFPEKIASSFYISAANGSEIISDDYGIIITSSIDDSNDRFKYITTNTQCDGSLSDLLSIVSLNLLSAISKRLALGGIYMDVAKRYASLSTCTRRHVGAILVKDGRIISTGTNGSPEGTPHCIDVGCLLDDKNHCQRTVHAEQNAILFCAREGISMKGASIYCSDFPCTKCLQSILQAGISAVYFERDYTDIYNKTLAEQVQSNIDFYNYDKGYFKKMVFSK